MVESDDKKGLLSAGLLSVGIDIGTTSSHLVFSRLHIDNITYGDQVPRFAVCKREIVFESPVHYTPFREDGLIDSDALCRLIEGEYARADIDPSQVQCGAAIITGGTARLENAAEVIERLAHLAGDFVSASAGPNLESILAARGSGAVDWSLVNQAVVANVDIGGGTTNIAIYESGRLHRTCCLELGARFIRFGKGGSVAQLSKTGIKIAAALGLTVEPGVRLDHGLLIELAFEAARRLVNALTAPGDEIREILVTEMLDFDLVVDRFCFSGGVARLMESKGDNMLEFDDMGHYLAQALLEQLEEKKLPFEIASHAIRATVIGAGSHSLMLSGHTVSVEEKVLPLRNIPILRPFEHEKNIEPKRLSALLSRALKRLDLDETKKPIAICLPGIDQSSFEAINCWCKEIILTIKQNELPEPYIIVIKEDAGMAIGQLLKAALAQKQILVIDGIDCEMGDFLEVGKSLLAGSMCGSTLPVTVKTLLFRM
ncbi:MAG: ethanolamine ammonia-lyase reactivating factor EutA [Candidatus Obscuribacterales bacterium]|nr:ethanolamine ammonia-lyase reactivating factor EutA [Candidatus Obscuribacterales bacterium]